MLENFVEKNFALKDVTSFSPCFSRIFKMTVGDGLETTNTILHFLAFVQVLFSSKKKTIFEGDYLVG